MKLEFLYTDDSYKGKIHDIKLEDSVILSHTNKSGLFIFSYEVKGENKDSARILSNIKSQVKKIVCIGEQMVKIHILDSKNFYVRLRMVWCR